jgi:Patatin-like phospholipase
MPQIAPKYLGRLQECSAAIRVARAPLLLAALSFLVLSAPAQILELYLLLARNWTHLWPQALLGLVSLGALSLFIAFVSRGLLIGHEDGNQSQGTIVRALPGVLGVLPLLGAALGLYTALQATLTEPLLRSIAVVDAIKTKEALKKTVNAITAVPNVDVEIRKLFPIDSTPRDLRPDDESLGALGKVIDEGVPPVILDLPKKTAALTVSIYSTSALCVLLALGLFVVFVRQPTAVEPYASGRRLFHPLVFAVFMVAFLLLTAVFAAQSINAGREGGYDFTAVPRAMGTLALVNLSLIFLIFFSSLLTRAADRSHVPIVAPLIAVAFLASFFDLNDNHAVRLERSPADATRPDKRPAVQDAFNAWFASRPAEYRAKFAGKRYPVYVVAAQGGGIYAANLAGLFLARLYDRCPLIRHHIFAVSGVSGGSVGAGFFAALLNEAKDLKLADTCDLYLPPSGGPHAKGPLQTKMELLLQTDFLAPVAASFLFPDLLQRFIPVPIAAFDRARAFEAGVESAWDVTVKSKSNPLRQPFSRHWRPDGDSPMLLLNATIAETGRQIAVSPVELKPFSLETSADLQSFQTALRVPEELDVPLSTAMSLSARFPVVMPAGLVRSEKGSLHLVDGGYFENSAIESSLGLIDLLRAGLCPNSVGTCEMKAAANANEPKTSFDFKVFPLTEFDPAPDYRIGQRNTAGGLNEVLSPVRAMYNARVARGDLAVQRAANSTASFAGFVLLSQRVYSLPLGWQLSHQVQDIIAAQVAVDCYFGPEFFQFVNALSTSIKWIDAGLEVVEARQQQRKPREYFTSPLAEMLEHLKLNHCATTFMLINGDVWKPPI